MIKLSSLRNRPNLSLGGAVSGTNTLSATLPSIDWSDVGNETMLREAKAAKLGLNRYEYDKRVQVRIILLGRISSMAFKGTETQTLSYQDTATSILGTIFNSKTIRDESSTLVNSYANAISEEWSGILKWIDTSFSTQLGTRE